MKIATLKHFKKPDLDQEQLDRCSSYLQSVGYVETYTGSGIWSYGPDNPIQEMRVQGVMNLLTGMRAVAKCGADLVVTCVEGGGLALQIQ